MSRTLPATCHEAMRCGVVIDSSHTRCMAYTPRHGRPKTFTPPPITTACRASLTPLLVVPQKLIHTLAIRSLPQHGRSNHRNNDHDGSYHQPVSPLCPCPRRPIVLLLRIMQQRAGLPIGSLFPAEFLEVQPWSSPVLWGGGRGGACRLRPSPWRTKCADNAPALHRPNKKRRSPELRPQSCSYLACEYSRKSDAPRPALLFLRGVPYAAPVDSHPSHPALPHTARIDRRLGLKSVAHDLGHLVLQRTLRYPYA